MNAVTLREVNVDFFVNPNLKIYFLPAVNSDFFSEFVLLSSKLIEEFK